MALTRPRYSDIVDTDYKNSVRVVTTTDITLSGGAPLNYDSLTFSAGDRILVAGQANATQNGIYYVTVPGTGSNGTWVRATDASTSDRVTAGFQTYVGEGTYAGQQWRLTNSDPITLGVTNLNFIAVSLNVGGAAGQIQYNLAGAFAGAANLRYDNATGNVVITGNISTTSPTAGALVVGGGVGISGNIVLAGGFISNIADPVAAQDAATKNYVDTQLSGISATTISNGSASVTTIDDGGTGNVIISGNTFIDALFWANGTPFSSSTYSNVDVAAYLPIYTGNVGAGNVNVTNTMYAANIVTTGTSGNISGADVISANAFVFSANGVNILTGLQGSITTINANVGAYQTFANANVVAIQANLGAYQTFANSNVASLQDQITGANTNIQTTSANLGAYQTFSNANAASQQTQIDNLVLNANANVAAYLPTYTGILGGTLSTPLQPNITTLAGLTSFGSNFGDTIAQGNLTVVGNLTIQGNTLVIGSNNLTVTDSIIDLHTFANLDPLLSDDGRDIGFRFHYYKGSDDHAFFGWENDTETLIYLQRSDEVTSNISGTYGNVQFGSLLLSNTTAATSTTSGAFQVRGGAGIGGVLWIQNTGDVSANIGTLFLGNASTNANLGAYQTFANANVSSLQNQITGANTNIQTTSANLGAFQAYANTKIGTNSDSNLVVVSNTQAISTTTGALVVQGGVSIATGNLYIGGSAGRSITATGNLVVSGSISTSTTTGAIVVTGGIGISGALYAGSGFNFEASGSQILSYSSGVLSRASGGLRLIAGGPQTSRTNLYLENNSGAVLWGGTSGASTPPAAVFGITLHGGDGEVFISKTTTSTSTTTGALQVSGGVGISGALYTGGIIDATGNIVADSGVASTSTTTGALIVNGGAGISGNLFAAGNVILGTANVGAGFSNVVIQSNASSSSATTGALVVRGGIGVALGIVVGASGPIIAQSTLEATTTGVAAITTSGGIGAAKNIIAGGNLFANATTISTSTTTGALRVAGGVGIAGNVTAANVFATGIFVGSGGAVNGLFWSANNQPFSAGGTAAGATTNIQYNNAGAFAGASNFTYTAASGNVVVGTTTTSASTTTGALVVGGGVGVAGNVFAGGNVYVRSRIGFTFAGNSTSAVYQQYNAATNSLDTIFG